MSTNHSNGHFPMNLPILTGKNYDNWCKQMKVVFRFQEMWNLVTEGVPTLGARATDEDKESNKELKKRDYKALFIIHQCLAPDNFEKVGDCESSKEAWDILAQSFGGAEQVKEVKLQTFKRQFDLIQMEESETVSDYFTKVIRLVNQIKSCGEVIETKFVVSKILRSLTPRFDHVVAAIETSKRISEISKEELLGCLESNEQRMNERKAAKGKSEIALQVQSNRGRGGRGRGNGNKGRGNYNNNAKEFQTESSNSKKSNNFHGNSRDECNASKPQDEDAKMVKQEENEVLLMVTLKEEIESDKDQWYLDTGCSTHMTGRKDWFVKINQTAKGKVKFADDSTLAAIGTGDVSIKKKNGGSALISDVLYIPDIMEHRCLATSENRSEWLWHYRLGHLNFRDLNQMQRKRMVSGLPDIKVSYEVCEECVQAKQPKSSFSKDAERRTKDLLEIVYSDVCGPLQVNSLGGNKYFVTFIDNHSRKLWTYLINKKSEVLEVFKRFKSLVERQSGFKIKVLRTDGGGEYMSSEFTALCEQEGIIREVTPPYTPQQNDIAERKNRTIMNMVRSMLNSKDLPKELWGEAVATATYVLNRLAYKHVPGQLRKKLDNKSEMMILVGYHNTGGYKLFDPINRTIVISRDVLIDETKEWDWKKSIEKSTFSIMCEDEEVIRRVDQSESSRPRRSRQMSARLQECEITQDNEVNEEGDLVHLAFLADSEPVNDSEALKSSKWREAVKEELRSIESNNTWSLTELPPMKKAIAVKWVYKVKMSPQGEITRHKATLVAKRFLQREGIDYEEVYAPVARIETIRLVVAMANINNWSIHQMDVKCAFLNGPLSEEVFVKQPPGFEVKGQTTKVYKLHKALYGLKQAHRAWNKNIDGYLSQIGFTKCVTEHGVCVRKEKNKGAIILCLYVDDLLITGSNEEYIADFKKQMMREFEMTDIGHLSYFLRIEFARCARGLMMHQKRYASEILKRFDMVNCNLAITPAKPRLQISKCEEEDSVDPTKFRSLIGSLRYLCNTRPGLVYSVGIVSRFMNKPKVSHLAAVKRILRYVKGTTECGSVFPASDVGKNCKLVGYTDASWCGDVEDRKSTAGYLFFIGDAPISWCSKKEQVVALSSCEVEYITASMCATQAIWLRNLIEEIAGKGMDSVTLKIDNVSAINLAIQFLMAGVNI
ncbi:hypothetical protein TSUD_385290 [Trifolium subterraneum]|uniref:Integrase catalytic domain-containing protein n=1 Tax=Trifolium subterraneum TaxID=3900 RepID=A0A2Z6MET5_TRISU|nr:hypothetical protein TSUD_385290 [Trifolium subterraneum]